MTTRSQRAKYHAKQAYRRARRRAGDLARQTADMLHAETLTDFAAASMKAAA
ncbi:hypothetical protein [Eilatimonas milleporae]|uniref:Uncharacterized protein n=1 Tax=Eilatimonas milleporae TaxID=911205 RepID=A0A3M0C4B5_9PROT|nr:hypothetical protein [Eilatimonas milleporae]RMB04568.1 hypothetical protein BXY39_2836 [Eilatimonas milleporae]